jgi:hypothetical protein
MKKLTKIYFVILYTQQNIVNMTFNDFEIKQKNYKNQEIDMLLVFSYSDFPGFFELSIQERENKGNERTNLYQCLPIEPKYFTNQDHLFSYWVLFCSSSSNNEGIVDIHPSKFYM